MTSEGTTIRTSRSLAADRSRSGYSRRRRHAAAQFLRGLRRQARATCPIPRPSQRRSTQPPRELMALRTARSCRISPAPCFSIAPAAGVRLAQCSRLRSPARVRRFPCHARFRCRSWSAWAGAANGPAASARACCPQRLAGGRSHAERFSRASRCWAVTTIDDEGVKAAAR